MYDLHHLRNNRMTYTEHLMRALYLSFLFYLGFILTFVHAFIPCVLTTISTDTNHHIYEILHHNDDEVEYNEEEKNE